MITFLDPELYRAEASPWFSAQALAQGADAARVEKLVQAAAAVADEDFVIDTERAISRLLENGPPAAEASSGYYADMLYRSAWKLQGTDGVRGIVASSGDPDYALRRYLAERLITPEFCRLYAAGFIALLERGSIRESGQESIPADAHRQSGDVSVEYCREYPAALVIGEDGRDWYAGTGLKAAVLDVALKKVLRVVDLGIVPTPYLAAYTQRFACAGIMLTASHNPAEENGLKLFVNGRKLYPWGDAGEYRLSYLTLQAETDISIQNDISCSDICTKNYYRHDIHDAAAHHLGNFFRGSALSQILDGQPIIIDSANGAATTYIKPAAAELGIRCEQIGAEPGPYAINSGCGAALLEELPPRITAEQYARRTDWPKAVTSLFTAGRASERPAAYAGVLDGDADRGYLLVYEKEQDVIHLCDGDCAGYLIASEAVAHGGDYSERKRETKGNIVDVDSEGPEGAGRTPGSSDSPAACAVPAITATVESDLGLIDAVSRFTGKVPEIVCVGDRWLTFPDHADEVLELTVGFERSGHVIVPLPVPEFPGSPLAGIQGRYSDNNSNALSSAPKDLAELALPDSLPNRFAAPLLAGNGLVTILLALLGSIQKIPNLMSAAMIETGSAEREMGKAFLFPRLKRGFQRRAVLRHPRIGAFYRDSPLWKSLQAAAEKLLPWKAVPLMFPQEPDLLYLRLLSEGRNEETSAAVGCLYVRNSGTEAKLTVALSLIEPECLPCVDLLQGLTAFLRAELDGKEGFTRRSAGGTA